MGDVDESFGGEDPFNIFNNIFQQHMQSFMNMNYENDINVNSIFNNIPGFHNLAEESPFGNIHIRVHTFPVNSSERINNKCSNNESDNESVEDIHFGGIFNKLFSKSTNKIEKMNKQKIIYNKPDPIYYDLTVSLSDIYNEKKRNNNISKKIC